MDELVGEFLSLSIVERQRRLVRYAHELTILSRMYFADSEVDSARSCNETMHRVLGFYFRMESLPVEEAAAESFIKMLVNGARASGWSHDLQRSMGSQ